MSQSAMERHRFIKEIVRNKRIWTICDNNGFPAPINNDGDRVMPFWSSSNRANKVIINVSAYSKFRIHEISLEDFKIRWLVGMEKDKLRAGINWFGSRATGFDVEPNSLLKSIENEENNIKET
ncbi:MAG: DUF2750 domain-containing protein [Ruminiclostridium sp.]